MTPRPALSLRTLLVVIAGGMLGVALRAAIVLPLGDAHSAVVVATVLINIVGSGLLGLVVGLIADRRPLARAFVGTGVVGGFTTYSSFAVHAVQVTGDSGVLWSACVIGVSLAGGMLAAVGGLAIGRRIAGRSTGGVEPEVAE